MREEEARPWGPRDLIELGDERGEAAPINSPYSRVLPQPTARPKVLHRKPHPPPCTSRRARIETPPPAAGRPPTPSRPACLLPHPAPPTPTPCYCRIRLNKIANQTASAPLLPPAEEGPASCMGAFAVAFHVSKANLDRATAKPGFFGARHTAWLKVAVYAGRRGSTCGVSSGRLLGKVVVPLDLRTAAAKPVVFHSGWVAIGKRRAGCKPPPAGAAFGGAAAGHVQLNLTVRAEPDPRFVFEFDGELAGAPGAGPDEAAHVHLQVLLPQQQRPPLKSDPGNGGCNWLAKFGSERERAGKERKGWSVTVHDLSGSPVALASMVTPFVGSPGTDRVSRSNPGGWLILCPVDGTWMPWGRLECWCERGGLGDGASPLYPSLEASGPPPPPPQPYIEACLDASLDRFLNVTLTLNQSL
ncbi:hypothetical protein SETIT_8G108100v2 [Setaria italica]|uniref:Uncharacterized protein n=1 Tax=Setaria italica TaxID=4555 RepID=A0A368S6P2_SETIT|nr:hypothetical protein SETIT_8G108100v2 [Setaria italica]